MNAEAQPGSATEGPLCVDLDGTLVATDTLHELALGLLRERPALVFALPFWLVGGRASLKARLSQEVALEVRDLPYREPVLEAIREARDAGRETVLVTAADRAVAEAVASEVGLFDRVLASDGADNLKGETKAQSLAAAFGEGAFEYLGDATADLPVWAAAGGASPVAPSERLLERARAQGPVRRVLGARVSGRERQKEWRRALRLHQWVKNALVFLPLIASHSFFEPALALRALLAFICFGLVASGTYVWNDLLDLPADRCHREKRRRPFASGRLPLASGIAAVPVLVGGGFALAALTLGAPFTGWLAIYALLTVAYSLWIKRVAIADVVVLSAFYALRVIAGGAAVGITPSPWLLGFCLFFFLNLAFLKRYADLSSAGPFESPGRRGYRREDGSILRALGPASGYMAVAILALYIQSEEVELLYANPTLLWLTTPLVVFWFARAWLFAHRGELHHDPVVFAIRDPGSWWVALAGVAVVLAASH